MDVSGLNDKTSINSQLMKFNYLIKVRVALPEEILDLDEIQVNSISFNNDYINNFFPIIRLDINLTDLQKKKIQENRLNTKFVLTINKTGTNEEYNEENQQSIDMFGEYIMMDKVFQAAYIDPEPDLGERLDNSPNLQEDMRTLNSNELSQHMEFYLFDLDLFNKSKNIINVVLKDCNILNAIGYVLNKTGCEDVILDNPDNEKTYEQIIIPPFNLNSSIKFLQETYGIYKKGLVIYQDINHLYILSNNLDIVNVPENEYENVIIQVPDPASDTNSPYEVGTYIDETHERYCLKVPSSINIDSTGQLNKELIGNKIRIYNFNDIMKSCVYDENNGKFDFKTGYKEIDLSIQSNEDNPKIKYYNYTGNPYTLEALQESIKDNNTILGISFNELDMSIITPNRRYFFEFTETDSRLEYNGRYKIIQSVIVLARNNADKMFSLSGYASFKKSDNMTLSDKISEKTLESLLSDDESENNPITQQ